MSNTNVQYLNGYGPPKRTTVGAVGDKYTDLHTGIVYKCMFIYACNGHDSNELEYIWEDLGTTCLPRDEYEAVANEISRKANAVINHASGDAIAISDSAAEPFQSMKVFGKSEQVQYSGKNLFQDEYIGIPTAGYINAVLSAGTYTLSTCDGNSFGTSVYFRLHDSSGNLFTTSGHLTTENATILFSETSYSYYGGSKNSSITFTIDDDYQLNIGLLSSDSTRQVVLVSGSTIDRIYEPYTGGVPAPNPNYPQEITSVGESGSVDIGVYGKNLLDESFVTCKATETTQYHPVLYSKKWHVEAGKTYTLSFDTENTGVNVYINQGCGFNYAAFNMDGKRHSFTTTISSTISYDENDEGNVIIVSVSSSTGVAAGNISNVMLTLIGNYDTYEPYNKQSISFSAPNGLPGIKVTDASVGNYTDSEGTMWCCDEIDLERGKYVQRIWKGNPVKPIVFTISDNNGRCSMFNKPFGVTFKSADFQAMSDIALWSLWGNGNDMTFAVTRNGMYYKDSTKTLEEVNAMFAEIGVNFEVAAMLETPIEHDLTENELNKFKALTMNYPNTTLLSEAHMEIDYVADTKLYIEKKYAELAAAIV